MTKITLRATLEEGPVLMAGIYDCLSAAVCEEAGFRAMCLGGAGVAASSLGLPDIGLVSFGELFNVAQNVIARSKVPVVIDIDTGFGNELNVMRTCERLAAAGAAAVHLEDQTFPKRCGHLAGKDVIDTKSYLSKVKAAAHALKGSDCLLIARTDAYYVNGLEDSIQRCLGALENGADMTFVEAPTSRESVAEIGERVPGWKMFNLATGGGSPSFTFKELTGYGYNLVSVPGVSMMSAITGIRETCRQVLGNENDEHIAKFGMSPRNIFEIVGLNDWLAKESQFVDGAKTGAGEIRPVAKA